MDFKFDFQCATELSLSACLVSALPFPVGMFFRKLNQKEFDLFDIKVKKSKLTREAYLRQLVQGLVPREALPPDYYGMMKGLYQIGNNLNQISLKAHTMNVIDVKRFDEAMRLFRQTVMLIMEAVILPRPIE